MVHTVQRLRHLGVEDLVLPLPKIVVVGDQSTGKSSLIEGMSGIKVPRKAGTCTRCPLEIELNDKPDTPWTCKVALCYKYVYDNSAIRSARSALGPTKQRPLGPWISQEPETFQFCETTVRAMVPEILERAQLAILNPGSPYEDFLSSAELSRTYQVKFSPNVIRLKISGPSLPNLAFYDLPGVINVSDSPAEEYLVRLVRNLVTEYIKEESCINLLALPMSDDPANSSALRLVGEIKAKGRTVGVLTKPDRIQQCEDLQQWIQILNGERFELGHGYFVVKNNPDVTVDHETARSQEQHFFDTERLWISLQCHSSRFGTSQLQNSLSQILTLRIQESLPTIIEQVQGKAMQIDMRLLQLPEPPQGNLPMRVLERIIRFGHALQHSIDGDTDNYPFQREWTHLIGRFHKTMYESRPILKPLMLNSIKHTVEDAHQNQPGTPTPQRHNTVSIMLDSDDEAPSNSTTRKRGLAGTPHTSPAKYTKLHEIPLHSFSPKISTTQAVGSKYSKMFTLPEVSQHLQDTQIIGMPGQNPKAIERMAKQCCRLWEKPLESFLEATEQLCRQTIVDQAEAAFEQWHHTPLQATVHATCDTYLNTIMGYQRDSTMLMLGRECTKPMALNDEAMNMAYEKWYKTLYNWRRERRIEEKRAEQETVYGGTPSKGKSIPKPSDEQLGPDPYGQELSAVAVIIKPHSLSSGTMLISSSVLKLGMSSLRRVLSIMYVKPSIANSSSNAAKVSPEP